MQSSEKRQSPSRVYERAQRGGNKRASLRRADSLDHELSRRFECEASRSAVASLVESLERNCGGERLSKSENAYRLFWLILRPCSSSLHADAPQLRVNPNPSQPLGKHDILSFPLVLPGMNFK